MFLLKKGNQPGVYVPLRALFLVSFKSGQSHICQHSLKFCGKSETNFQVLIWYRSMTLIDSKY